MSIDVFSTYKVKIINESSRLSDECITKYDNIFVEEISTNTLLISGGQLMIRISEKLSDPYMVEFVIVGNEFHFEYFNCNNGESWRTCFQIHEVDQDV